MVMMKYKPAAAKEPNDCTVRAVSAACEIEYREAWELLASAGRKPGKGFNMASFLVNRIVNGFRFQGHCRENLRLAEFSLIDRAIVRVANFNGLDHVFAMVDGAVIDTTRPDTQWQVCSWWDVIR